MNKELFFNCLKETLEANNIENIDEIISEYEKKYEIGVSAGMEEEDIIESLGKIEDILNKYVKKESDKITYNIKVEDVFSSDFRIHKQNKDGIDINVSKEIKDYVEISTENHNIIIRPSKEFKGHRFFRSLRSGLIDIYYGPNVLFDDISLTTVSGDFDVDDITCNSATIITVSGDFDFEYLNAKEALLSTVSGDIDFNRIFVDVCRIKTVSGDIKADYCQIENLEVTTVSGDVDLTGVVKNKKSSSISGDITINEYK